MSQPNSIKGSCSDFTASLNTEWVSLIPMLGGLGQTGCVYGLWTHQAPRPAAMQVVFKVPRGAGNLRQQGSLLCATSSSRALSCPSRLWAALALPGRRF